MKRFIRAVKLCAVLDVALLVSWFIWLAINPVQASHAAFAALAAGAAILVGALLSAPVWLPLAVLGATLWTGNSVISFVSNHVPEAARGFRQKLFGGTQ